MTKPAFWIGSEAERKLREVELEIRALELSQMENADRMKVLERERVWLEKNVDAEAVIIDGIRVTEHAILRYLERVCGINIEEVAYKIVGSEQFQKVLPIVVNGDVPIGDKVIARVVNKTVVTVLKKA